MEIAKLGPILPEALYPLPVFYATSGIRRTAVRELRRKGFTVLRCGKRAYVKGSDFIDWLTKSAAKS